MLYRVLTDGCVLPFSTCDSRLAEMPAGAGHGPQAHTCLIRAALNRGPELSVSDHRLLRNIVLAASRPPFTMMYMVLGCLT